MRYSLVIGLASLVLMGQGCLGGPAPSAQLNYEGENVGTEVGQVAPDFVLERFDGQMVSLSDFRGKPIFIDFWAAWCPFCVGEMPEIEAVHQQYDDLVVLGIHRTDTEPAETGRRFADDRGVTYPLLKDASGEVYEAFTGGRPFMPVAIYIDADGVIRELSFGPKTSAQIKEGIDKIR